MIDQAKNKAMDAAPKSKVEPLEQEFFFPGEGQWKPVTVTAKDIGEATEKWEGIKESVNS